jgi:hypothetical protein
LVTFGHKSSGQIFFSGPLELSDRNFGHLATLPAGCTRFKKSHFWSNISTIVTVQLLILNWQQQLREPSTVHNRKVVEKSATHLVGQNSKIFHMGLLPVQYYPKDLDDV